MFATGRQLFLVSATLTALVISGCSGTTGDGPGGSGGSGSGSMTGGGGTGGSGGRSNGSGGRGAGTGGAPGPGVDFSGELFLISTARLPELRQKVAANAPEWVTLKSILDNNADRASAEDNALAYLLTNDASYAGRAFDKAMAVITATTAAGGVYDPGNWYEVGENVRPVALTLNWCGAALSSAQQTALLEYMKKAVYRVWFDNGQANWQIDDPGGNFHMAYLEATAFAGYSFRKAGMTAEADQYLGILNDKLTKTGGVIDYLTNGDARGGDFYEGANYGQRSKQRLFMALALVASQGGTNYFASSRFFEDSVLFALYQTQPGNKMAHPTGNMARTGRQKVSSFDRYYMQLDVYHLPDGQARRLGQWFLQNLVPNYDAEFRFFAAMWMDVVFKLDLPSEPPTGLPLAYVAEGTGLAFFRSSWQDDATGVAVDGFHQVTYSHQKTSVGGISITRRDFLTVDPVASANSNCGNGSGGLPPGENVIVATAASYAYVGVQPGMGLAKFDDGDGYGYAQVNATGNNGVRQPDRSVKPVLNEWTREVMFVHPDVTVLYDRVDGADTAYHNRLHFPGQVATGAGGAYSSTFNGGAITVLPFGGGATTVRGDNDLGSCPGQRMELAPAMRTTRYITALRAGVTTAPALAATRVTAMGGQMEGVAWDNQVVLFSANPQGAAAQLPFSYTVPGTASHTHTLANIAGSVSFRATRSGNNTMVTVSAGDTAPTGSGVVRFTD